MKKILLTMSVAVMLGLGITSCNNQPQKNDTQKSATKGTVADSNEGLKIAYVEYDSILSQYNFSKDAQKILDGKRANAQKTIQSKQQTLQQKAQDLEQGYRANKYTQAQVQQIQAGLQQQAQEGDALAQRLQNELAKEADNYNKALSDSVHHFLAEYNKDKKFSIIFAKQGDNILYAQDAYDITDQVIAGLNKRYKGMNKK